MSKYRLSFVTNSSSSSYICDVCGQDASGWDMCLSEAEMYECSNGHIFCEHHAEDFNKDSAIKFLHLYIEDKKDDEYWKDEVEECKDYLIKIMNDETEQDDIDEILEKIEDRYEILEKIEDRYEFRYNYPKQLCPICGLSTISDSTLLSYIAKKDGYDLKETKEEIRKMFNDYDELNKYIK